MPTPTTTTFTPTGAAQTFVVPYYTPGTFNITAKGGEGARSAGVPAGAPGSGGSILGWWDPAPGTVLTIIPGHDGAGGHLDLAAYAGGVGGKELAGGGTGAGRGGSASVVLIGSTIVMVAGGGGGGGQSGGNGGGGGGGGGLGVASGGNGGESPRGYGATTSAAGAAGTWAGATYATAPGAGSGHAGGVGSRGLVLTSVQGGGGGGGMFGGGGGGSHVFVVNANNEGGGGGGGSSWCDASLFSSIDNTGGQEGDGIVTITYDWIADWSPPTDGWSVGSIRWG